MKKVLLVYRALYSGKYSYAGMEKMMIWLGNTLANSGCDVSVCTLYDKERNPHFSPLIKCYSLGIPYHDSFFLRNFTLFFVSPFKICQALKGERIENVINFGESAFFPFLFLKKLFGYRFITSERGDPAFNANLFEKFRRKLVRFSDVGVFQTVGARDYYISYLGLKKDTYIIPNSIVIPSEKWNVTNTEKTIISVGRIDLWQKRQDVLIKAFKRFYTTHKDYRLLICGSGEDTVELTKLINNESLSNAVVLEGAVKNVKDYLLKSRVFVLSSDFEGIPNALLEAMALGMPVASTNCSPGGASLLIDNQKNGILVGKGDDEALASAIGYLADNPKIALQLGETARESMNRFTPDAIIKKWLTVLN